MFQILNQKSDALKHYIESKKYFVEIEVDHGGITAYVYKNEEIFKRFDISFNKIKMFNKDNKEIKIKDEG